MQMFYGCKNNAAATDVQHDVLLYNFKENPQFIVEQKHPDKSYDWRRKIPTSSNTLLFYRSIGKIYDCCSALCLNLLPPFTLSKTHLQSQCHFKIYEDYNEIIRTCRLAIDFLIGRTNWIKIWISMWMAVVKHLLNIFKNKFVLIPENGFPPTICNHNFYIMRVHLLSADMTRKEIVLGEIVVWPLLSKCFIYSGWCK